MSFTDFHFHPTIDEAIRRSGFTTATPIQQQAISPILEGHDILGLAQTGTGKTAAFVLPIVQQLLQSQGKHVKTLIIAPTRELAEQINEFIQEILTDTRLRSIAIYGGVGKQAQITQLRSGRDIVVACPGRLLDILNDKAIDLSRIQHLVLDEADHMFDNGFLPDIRRILKRLPQQRQTLVFSATMPQEIRHLAEEILVQPVTIQVDRIQSPAGIAHTLYDVKQNQKTDLLIHLLQQGAVTSSLVFTRTKYKARNLATTLERSGFKVTSLQGNLSQSRRQQALDGFKKGTYDILVATDIAARGIDVSGISHVFNYDMPDTAEAYIHRTGRTGRALSNGEALTFVTPEDAKIINLIEKTLKKSLQRQNIPLLSTTDRQEDPRMLQGRKRGPAPVQRDRQRRSFSAPQRGTGPAAATSGVFGLSGASKRR